MDKKIYLIAHNIRSLHNVGSFFRSADGFGINKIYLTGFTPSPESKVNPANGEECRQKKQIGKTALGAEDWIAWEKKQDVLELIKELKSHGVSIYALETDENSQNIYQFAPKFPCAIIVGNEIDGIDKDILSITDTIISIPMSGQKVSLNVSVAAGIALYEISRHKDYDLPDS